MKHLNYISHAFMVVALISTGLGCTTSSYSRERAARAVILLDDYEKQQKDRIDSLNEEYVKVEARLRQEHLDALDRAANSDRDVDARQMADEILVNWEETTLTSALVSRFIESKEREIVRVSKKREDLAVAQKAYQDAYQKLALPLQKVKEAKAAMQKLAEKDASGPSRTAFLRIINEVRKYMEEAEAAEKKAKEATTTT